MKKKQPFWEIIDLNEEYKDYKELCNNNSKKYTYYDDWKKYMIGKFKMLPKEHLVKCKSKSNSGRKKCCINLCTKG